jgi:DNA topoisomerase-2
MILNRYNNAMEILKEFFHIRLLAYDKRKEILITKTKKHLRKLTNKARFIKLVIEKKINLLNQTESSIIKELKKIGSNVRYSWI